MTKDNLFRKREPRESLTDDEVDIIANVLLQIGRISDRKRMIDVMAIVCKVCLFDMYNPRYAMLRRAAGITKVGKGKL